MVSKSTKAAFTLVELLLALGFLTTLLVLVILIVNPAKYYAEENNTQRREDVNNIITAIYKYVADNNSDLTALGIGAVEANIGSDLLDVDLCPRLVPMYLAEMPVDPMVGSYMGCSKYDTGYTVSIDLSEGTVTVDSPNAQLDATIRVTR